MSFNGSGGFSVDSDGYPVVYDTFATDTFMNAVLAELAAGLSNTICRDGQSVISQNLPMNAKRLTNLGNASAVLDAANVYSYLTNFMTRCTGVGGTANAIELGTSTTVNVTYTAGLELWFVPTAANTGAVTIDLNGLGVKDLTKIGTVALAAGDLQSGEMAHVIYDGTRFQLVSPYYAEGSWTPSVGGTATYTAQVGRYRKIGSAVFVMCKLIINAIGTGSTDTISGLPFTSMNLADQNLTVGDFSSLANNVVWIGARVNNNATTISMRSLTAAGASTASTSVFGNSTAIGISGVYFI